MTSSEGVSGCILDSICSPSGCVSVLLSPYLSIGSHSFPGHPRVGAQTSNLSYASFRVSFLLGLLSNSQSLRSLRACLCFLLYSSDGGASRLPHRVPGHCVFIVLCMFYVFTAPFILFFIFIF